MKDIIFRRAFATLLIFAFLLSAGCDDTPDIFRNPDAYLPYYFYDREFTNYVNQENGIKTAVENKGYQIVEIGKSIEGRPLYAIFPNQLQLQKDTIVITCRHHGDEMASNYVLEGFLNKVFEHGSNDPHNWLDKFQLFVYPFINPDGGEAGKRVNANGLDLNRQWRKDLRGENDEIAIIHQHLDSLLRRANLNEKSVKLMFDLHGSDDLHNFVYRVPQNRDAFADYDPNKKKFFIEKTFFSDMNGLQYLQYYTMQTRFLENLFALDDFLNNKSGKITAAGDSASFGDEGMLRVVFGRQGYNALTHEIIKHPRKINIEGRTLDTLRNEGEAIYEAIWKTYGL